jgi:hypothetical protein
MNLPLCRLLSSLLLQPCLGVGHLDVQGRCTLNNGLAGTCRHVVSNLCCISAVLHHQGLQILHVVHHHLLEAVLEHVAGLGVGAVPDCHHADVALEATTGAVVDTTGPAPGLLQKRWESEMRVGRKKKARAVVSKNQLQEHQTASPHKETIQRVPEAATGRWEVVRCTGSCSTRCRKSSASTQTPSIFK